MAKNAMQQALSVYYNNKGPAESWSHNSDIIDLAEDSFLGVPGWWGDGVTFTPMLFQHQLALGMLYGPAYRLRDGLYYAHKAKDPEKVEKFEQMADEALTQITYWVARANKRSDVLGPEELTQIIGEAITGTPQKSNQEEFLRMKAALLPKKSAEELREKAEALAAEELLDKQRWFVQNCKTIESRLSACWSNDVDLNWHPNNETTRAYLVKAIEKLNEKLPKLEERFENVRNDIERGEDSIALAVARELLAVRDAIDMCTKLRKKLPPGPTDSVAVRERFDTRARALLAQVS